MKQHLVESLVAYDFTLNLRPVIKPKLSFDFSCYRPSDEFQWPSQFHGHSS